MKNTASHQPALNALIEQLSALPTIDTVTLFGSRARADAGERSDIDIAIYCPTANAKDWQAVLDVVENAATLLKIDCVRLDEQTDEKLLAAIARDGKLLYKRSL